ncbi:MULTISPECIES: hypothetical protein [unclassified Bradyrhizobium]|uniref:hypothetical protein n=1 Tax=unclassified Bradyrhizobium TaxID=2631580 RepID=UPI00247A141C|nr:MULTISPECIES: hypothetical protein [unclassified Bradyrhizobium]WGS17545.1 hypothetical protein MTX22_23180 [Bradyrhizobium sp. ISRA463]WGS24329.1 hypothetical protein MTX19_20850 [Bradyrhizobium sp. ISRA464]
MIQTVRNILLGFQIWPFAITAFIAITGAFVALIGVFLGSHDVMEFGKSAAGFGAMGFFGWLLFMIALRSA